MQFEEQPHLQDDQRSSYFSIEAVATQPRLLISKGILARYVLASYAVRKLGLKTMANAASVRNLLF